MIVVTGATGHLGKSVIENLMTKLPANQIAASVRDASKAEGFASRGVEVRTGDFADAASLEKAFAGADQVLIVSADKIGDEALQLHRNAIQAARNAGVGRVLYTSHMGARKGSPFLPADQHAGTEADLAASGLTYIALRHGFYAESCMEMIGYGLSAGELRMPEDGPVSWTVKADLAEADAAILAGKARWDGPTPALTATSAVTMAELASIASEVLGREIRHTVVSDDAWREAQIAAGMPAFVAGLLLGIFQAARAGEFAATDPTLGTLLGRPPLSIRDLLVASRG